MKNSSFCNFSIIIFFNSSLLFLKHIPSSSLSLSLSVYVCRCVSIEIIYSQQNIFKIFFFLITQSSSNFHNPLLTFINLTFPIFVFFTSSSHPPLLFCLKLFQSVFTLKYPIIFNFLFKDPFLPPELFYLH